MKALTFLVLPLLGSLLALSRATAATIEHVAGKIVVSGIDYAISFSDTNGSITSVRRPGPVGNVCTSGELGLWNVSFKEGGSLNATAFNASSSGNNFRWTIVTPDAVLRLSYTNSAMDVQILVSARSNGVDFTAQVLPRQKTVLEFGLPGRLRFAPDTLERLVAPLHSSDSVGAAFKAGFFKSQPESDPAGWETVVRGPNGYVTLFGGEAVSRPGDDPPVAISITTNGQAWFGTNVANRWNGASAIVNRPSARSQAGLVLADSVNGPYFAGSRLGGQGYLFRLGGNVAESQQELALGLVVSAIEHLAKTPAPGRSKVGLIALRRGPASGGWASVTVAQWRDRLQASAALSAAGLEVVELPLASTMLAALAATNFLAVLNPYGEWTPVLESGGMSATVSAIGKYVRAGGNWFEVGGYSFYYELRPAHYYSYGAPYPPLFADFLHLDAVGASASLYGVQPQVWEPWTGTHNPGAIFVPGRLAWGGDVQGGYVERAFGTFVSPGQSWQCPVVRLTLGSAAPEALQDYCRANQFTRRLPEKMSPEVYEKFIRSVLIYYAGNSAQKLEYLDRLPAPALVHFADYLMGGFDKQYPDHLPPNASFGTAPSLAQFFERCHSLGLLVMPYSNPTWWCDHPRGPTFLREGETPLLKRLDGTLSYESYGANDGYTVCPWHPAVQAANRVTVQQFTSTYPVDVLFQDQCGARTWQYDLNPASPTPYAYAEGMASMTAEDSRTKPLSTENGWDRIVNYESQFCGMTWALVPTAGAPTWRTFLKDRFSPATWDLFPLVQYVAHDKVSLLHHDLGQFVTNDEVLSWTLGLGYGLSYSIPASDLANPARLEWLRWLDRLQKSVCARLIGQPLTAFTHDRGTNPTSESDGVLRATYGPVDIVANLDPEPRIENARTLAPFGFVATAPGMIAANLSASGNPATNQSVSFVVDRVGGKTEFWIYAAGDRDVRLQLPQNLEGTAVVLLDNHSSNQVPVQVGAFQVSLGYQPTQERLLPPTELAGKAPLDWPGPKPAIGILNLAGLPLSWTSITANHWVQAFTASKLASQFGVPIRQITTFNELTAALQAGPTVWLAIVNPGGERFPTAAAGTWRTALGLIRDYVNRGGSWWETAGYSFYAPSYYQAGAWQSEPIGPDGMGFFGLPVGDGAVAQAPELMMVSPLGQTIFGGELTSRLQSLTSSVNRGLVRTAPDPGHLTLLAGAQQDFLGAYRLDGWGYLWRIGGFSPNPNVVLPAVTATMEYLYTHPPLPFESGRNQFLWHGRLTVASRPVLKYPTIGNGVFSLTIGNCAVGATNYLERSSDLASPSAWQTVATFLSPATETNCTDAYPVGPPQVFYRVRSVPAD